MYGSKAKSQTRVLLQNFADRPHGHTILNGDILGASRLDYCNHLICFLEEEEYDEEYDDLTQCSLLGFDMKTSLLTDVLWQPIYLKGGTIRNQF